MCVCVCVRAALEVANVGEVLGGQRDIFQDQVGSAHALGALQQKLWAGVDNIQQLVYGGLHKQAGSWVLRALGS